MAPLGHLGRVFNIQTMILQGWAGPGNLYLKRLPCLILLLENPWSCFEKRSSKEGSSGTRRTANARLMM